MKIETHKAYFVPTQELEGDFLKRAEEQGFLWRSGHKPSEFRFHSAKQSDLCICTEGFKRIFFDSVAHALRRDYAEIIEWKIEKPEPKPEIIRLGNLKIVFNGDYTIVTDGRFTGKAKRNPADEYDAVVGLKLAVERYEKDKQEKDILVNFVAQYYLEQMLSKCIKPIRFAKSEEKEK